MRAPGRGIPLLFAGAFLAGLLPFSGAVAFDYQLSGEWSADLRVPVAELPPDRLQQISTSLGLKADSALSEALKLRLELQAEGFASRPVGEEGVRMQVREAYLRYVSGGLELRAGQQILVWGNADVRNPTDFLSARDYNDFNPEVEKQRLGSPSLQVSWTPAEGASPWTLRGVVTPFFPQSRLLIPPEMLPAGFSDPEVKAPEFALRASYQGQGWDLSLSGFSGWNHEPFFEVASVSPAGVALEQRFRRLRALGVESSFTQDAWVFRGEAAYRFSDPEYLDAVMGAERPLGDRFRLQAQFLLRAYPDRPTDEPLNAFFFDYQENVPLGTTLRLSYQSESGDLESELFLMAGLTGGDYLVRPRISYRFGEGYRVQAGLDGYGGPRDRLLGSALPYRAVFTQLQKVF